MASSILSRTISSVVDKRIVLSNSQFGRPHGVASWNVLRVGLRFIMNNNAGNLSPIFFIGLCSGTSNMFFDATTTNFLGAYLSGTYTYAAGPPVKYTQNVIWPYTKVGAMEDTTTQTLGSIPIAADATLAQRKLLILEFTKGSPNFTINPLLVWDGTGTFDASTADLLYQSSVTVPALTDHIPGTSRDIASSEGPGTFNCVNIGWNQASPTIEICDLVVVKMS